MQGDAEKHGEKENEHKASMEDELLNKVEASALAHCQLHLNTKETANTKNTKKKKKLQILLRKLFT